MGGGAHHPGRKHRAKYYSPAQGSGRPGNRRVSSEQDRDVAMLRILPLEEAQNFIRRKAVRLAEAEKTVAPILDAVRKRGDEAVLEYARQFDGLQGNSVTISDAELRDAEAGVTPGFREALQTAAKNIREYAELQLPR